MKIPSKSIICLFFAICIANADPPDSFEEERYIAEFYAIDNTRTSVYLHPVSLLVGANAKMLLLYSTVEMPLSLYNAPIIKPSVLYDKDLLRLGTNLGFRHYPSGRGEGLYLQPQAGAFYISTKYLSPADFDIFADEDYKNNKKAKRRSGTWFDFMGYLGYAYKFRYLSIYNDTGIGYGCILSECSLIFDGNIGIGISF